MKVIFFLLLTGVVYGQDQWKNIYTEPAWTARDQWQRPNDIIQKMSIRKGSKIADVGCHEGYLTFKLSAVVGSTGSIYAVDVEQSKLDKLKLHAEQTKIENIITIKGNMDDPLLPLNTLDAVVILDSYHEMDEHDKILLHIFASLKPGGRLVICEPLAEERRSLSRDEQERKHELGMNFAVADLNNAGFQIVFSRDPFIDREKIKGDKLWIVVARKK